MRGTLLYQAGRYQEAVTVLQSLVDQSAVKKGVRADIMNNLASAYCRLGQQEKALSLWQSLTVDPAYLTPEVAWCNIGLLYLDRAQRALFEKHAYQRALTAFTQALAVASAYIDALYYAGYTCYLMREYSQALLFLEQLLLHAPEHEAAQQLALLIRNVTAQHTE